MASNPAQEAGNLVSAVVAGILGIAIVAVIVGRNAQTANVITSGGSALSSVIGAAVAPVSAGSSTTLPSSPSLAMGLPTNGTSNPLGAANTIAGIGSTINGVTGLANAFDPNNGNQDFSSADTTFTPDNALLDSAFAAAL